mgnify:CR=1 FL=1
MVSILVVGEKIGYGRIGIDISVLSIKSALMAHIRTNRVKGSQYKGQAPIGFTRGVLGA